MVYKAWTFLENHEVPFRVWDMLAMLQDMLLAMDMLGMVLGMGMLVLAMLLLLLPDMLDMVLAMVLLQLPQLLLPDMLDMPQLMLEPMAMLAPLT